jgi:hypothetical protein
MNHDEALQQRATEKYLLDELDPALRDQFEEHLFDCQECALDVRAAAMFVEQTKVVLAESPANEVRVPAAVPQRGWLSWLRPAFAAPVLAMLLVVIGYQNRLLREAHEPQVATWASVNIATRGTEATVVKPRQGEGFNLLVNLPPDQSYATYTLELYNPTGKLQWAGRIPAASSDDARSIYISGTGLEQGNYTLDTNGVTATGQSSKISSKLIEVQIQK